MADNASITILRNTQANINAEPIKDGNILFTTDQDINVIYTDVGTKRIKIGGTVPIDSTITANSVNPVTSKAIYNEFNNVQRQICTNLLNPTAQTQTIDGVTFTNNGDGTYTVNGTANENVTLEIYKAVNNFSFFQNKKIIGCPAGGSDGSIKKYLLTFVCRRKGDIWVTQFDDFGNGNVISNIPSNTTSVDVRIGILKGQTVNNLLFKPMLTTDLSATYDDFVPYTGDSGRLNEDVAALFDIVRPVGSLYSTTDANFNPNTAKGWHGTWERIKDCVIYAAGDSDTVGSIVGSNTHTLTIAELPSHSHSIPKLSGSTNSAGAHTHSVTSLMYYGKDWNASGVEWSASSSHQTDYSLKGTADSAGSHTHTVTTNASTTGTTGSGTAIDMRPRRLNSIVWKRVS